MANTQKSKGASILVRSSEDDVQRWGERAREAGKSRNQWAVDRLNEPENSAEARTVPPDPPAPARAAKRSRRSIPQSKKERYLAGQTG